MARWAAIIGPRGSGKSTHASHIVELLKKRGIRVGGFLQKGVDDELGRRSYNLHRLSSDEVLPLARPTSGVEKDGQTTFCSFAFIDSAFPEACSWLEQDKKVCSVLFLDEVSKLEVNAKGHYQAIRQALSADESVVVVLCVRADQLFYVVETFELEDDAVAALEVPGSDDDDDEFVAAIVEVAAGIG